MSFGRFLLLVFGIIEGLMLPALAVITVVVGIKLEPGIMGSGWSALI